MVDEQFPLQRKILKGQVVVRNEEANMYARSEMNNSGVNAGLFYFYVHHRADEFVYIMTRSNNGTEGFKWSK